MSEGKYTSQVTVAQWSRGLSCQNSCEPLINNRGGHYKCTPSMSAVQMCMHVHLAQHVKRVGLWEGTYRQIPGSLLRESVCKGRNGIWEYLLELCGANPEFLSGWSGPTQLSLSLHLTSETQQYSTAHVMMSSLQVKFLEVKYFKTPDSRLVLILGWR